METRVEQKITIQSDGDPIDHDKALAEAIQEATLMNPDMTVEKIEIQQQTASGASQWTGMHFVKFINAVQLGLFVFTNLKKHFF